MSVAFAGSFIGAIGGALVGAATKGNQGMLRSALVAFLLAVGCAHGPAWTVQALPPLKDADLSALSAERVRIVVQEKPFERTATEPETEAAVASFFLSRFIDTLSGYGVRLVPTGETLVVRLTARKAISRLDYCETHASGVAANIISYIFEGRAATGTAVHCPVGEFSVFVEARRPTGPDFAWVAELHGTFQLAAKDDSDQNRALTGAVLDAAIELLENPDLLAKLLQRSSSADPGAAPTSQESPSRRPVTRTAAPASAVPVAATPPAEPAGTSAAPAPQPVPAAAPATPTAAATKAPAVGTDKSKIVKCPECGASTPRGKFCSQCGKALPTYCDKCDAALPAASRFCPRCGAPVSAH